MHLSLSHIGRIGLGLTLACLLFTNATLANKPVEGVPDFSEENVIRKPTSSVTMYDFHYSKSSYQYSSYQPKQENSHHLAVPETILPKESNQEKIFPSLLLMLEENESEPEPVVREDSGKQSREAKIGEEPEILSINVDDPISDVAQIAEQLEEPSLIAAKPFEKIALHFDDSSFQKDNVQLEKGENMEAISIGTIPDKIDDQYWEALKDNMLEQKSVAPLVEEKTNVPQVDEKATVEEIDFDSITSVFSQIFIASLRNSRIWQIQQQLPNLSSMFNYIAER